jgi:phenylacetate-CoA ligase
VESIVREYDAIEEFQIYVWRKDNLQDEITVKVEIKPGREGDWHLLHRTLVKDLANAHEGLRFNVDRVEHGTLPRFELKAKRLVDARPVAQYS